MKEKNLWLVGISFFVIFLIIIFLNHRVSLEISQMQATTKSQQKVFSQPSQEVAVTKPKPPVIDPTNDPLAPMVKIKLPSPAESKPTGSGDSRRTFDMPPDTEMLIQ